MSEVLPDSTNPIDLSRLRQAFVDSFSLGELKTICQDIGFEVPREIPTALISRGHRDFSPSSLP